MSVAELPETLRQPNVARSLLHAMRPHQWVKNLTCFAGLIFSGRLFQPEMAIDAGTAFVSFCLIAPAIHLLNDYIDRYRDRLNPRSANRPRASGALPVWVAAVAFVGLVVAAGREKGRGKGTSLISPVCEGKEQVGCVAKTHREAEWCVIASSTHPTGWGSGRR